MTLSRSKTIPQFPRTVACTLIGCLTFGGLLQAAEEVRIGRYSTLASVPTEAQTNLLQASIQVHFPDRVNTVGKAVDYLLERSGYQLSDRSTADTAREALLALPLPAVHRSLGPVSLQMALETLAGPAFRLVEDPVHRLVSFELCRAFVDTAPKRTIEPKEKEAGWDAD